ncbi:MAG: hypothetical protein IJ525_02645 [Alphaproteobacteria bacterium]|nr:hypothetical protein [Alphaproteobacteria bacterium]
MKENKQHNIFRVMVFASFDAKGIVHDYVLSYLHKMSALCNKIVFIADNETTEEQKLKLSGLVDYMQFEKHGEYDFGSYKRGFIWLKKQDWFDKIDEIVFCNDSCFSVGEFKPVFDVMNDRKCDFWGMTENADHKKHLQSFFWVFKKNVFNNEVFERFINSIKHEDNFMDIVLNYEVPLTEYLEQKGFVSDAYIKGIYSPHQYPVTTLRKKMPLIKKKAFCVAEKILDSYSLEGIIDLFREIKKVSPDDYADIVNYFDQKPLHIIIRYVFKRNLYRIRRFLFQKKITRKGNLIVKICKIPVYYRKEKS